MFEEDYYIVRMMKSGANGFLAKSAGPDALVRAIDMVHKTGFYHNEKVTQILYEFAHKKLVDVDSITEREKIYLKHCCSEFSHNDIAELMKTTPKSVDGYRDSLFKKLHVNSRYSLIIFAIRNGFVTLETNPHYS